MENKMETAIMGYMGFRGFGKLIGNYYNGLYRVWGLWKLNWKLL